MKVSHALSIQFPVRNTLRLLRSNDEMMNQ